MKRSLLSFSFFFFLIISTARAQDFTGQWKGQFIDKSTSFSGWGGDKCEYVLELECKGRIVTGYSYTYFSEGGKRYYTICKLKGTLNKAGKYVEVTEFERTKTNVPVNIRNCFQVHKLTFYQQGDQQTLEGTWVPAPNQAGDCGYGNTLLTRRTLQKNSSFYNKKPNNNTAKSAKPNPATAEKPKTQPDNKATTTPPVAKKTPPAKTNPAVPENKEKETARSNNDQPETGQSQTVKPQVEDKKPVTDARFEKRNSDVLKTIEIDNKTFTVDLYDNGEIDGDSISLFFNGKLIISHKRLSDKALSMKLNIDETRDVNELIMYAENLGSIPPNTALMVVHDGDNRYEVRISSDLQKSGTIRFIHKPSAKAP
ncbi:MAG: hypothetical protein J0L54_11145 [Chitinophagales bacterium]|nr:hypothetical protein [Chitinophagales bacterium]